MTTIHIAPLGASCQLGTGTAHDPYRIAGPGHLDNFLPYINPYTTLHIHGRVEIGPNWSAPAGRGWCQLPGFVKLIGDGMAESHLVLSERANWYQDRPDGSALWFGAEGQNAAGWVVRDLHIDCNQAALPGRLPRGGLRFHGSDVLVERVRISGLRGDYARGFEAFPLSVINAPGQTYNGYDGNVIIRDLVVDDCAPNSFVSAVVVGIRDFGRPIRLNIVERANLDLGSGNHLLLSANCNTTFRDIRGRGAKYGLYLDETADGSPCQLDGVALLDSQLRVSYGGVNLVSVRDSDYRRNLTVRGNEFILDHVPGTDPAFVRLIGPAQFDDLVFEGNRIRSTHPKPPMVSADAPRATNVQFRLNTFPARATVHTVLGTSDGNFLWTSNRDPEGRNITPAKFS